MTLSSAQLPPSAARPAQTPVEAPLAGAALLRGWCPHVSAGTPAPLSRLPLSSLVVSAPSFPPSCAAAGEDALQGAHAVLRQVGSADDRGHRGAADPGSARATRRHQLLPPRLQPPRAHADSER
eukprot:6341526-Prymnesium_polylepis.2